MPTAKLVPLSGRSSPRHIKDVLDAFSDDSDVAAVLRDADKHARRIVAVNPLEFNDAEPRTWEAIDGIAIEHFGARDDDAETAGRIVANGRDPGAAFLREAIPYKLAGYSVGLAVGLRLARLLKD